MTKFTIYVISRVGIPNNRSPLLFLVQKYHSVYYLYYLLLYTFLTSELPLFQSSSIPPIENKNLAIYLLIYRTLLSTETSTDTVAETQPSSQIPTLSQRTSWYRTFSAIPFLSKCSQKSSRSPRKRVSFALISNIIICRK